MKPRILVVKLSSLGDLFHALPAVHLLKTGLDAEVDWITQPEYVPLVETFTDVDRVIPYPRRAFRKNFAAFKQTLRERRYDYGFDFQGLLKSALALRAARAERRIGPSFSREFAHLFYHATAGKPNRDRHAVDQLLDVVDHLQLPRTEIRFPVRFSDASLDAPAPRVALVPCSRWVAKNWPLERFAEVGNRLHTDHGASLFLVGAPGDQAACDQLTQALPEGTRNLCGKTSLVELGGVLAEMDLVISVDSGPMHMAAAASTPVVAIFGVTDPARTGPYGNAHRILMAEEFKNHPGLPRAFKQDELAGKWDVSTSDVIDAAKAIIS